MTLVRDVEMDDYLHRCLELEPAALTEEYKRVAMDQGYWNEKWALANRALLLAENEEEVVKARLFLRFKEGSGGKSPTVDTVKAAVTIAPEYQEVHLRVLELQHERDYLKGVLDSMKTKRDMTSQMGHFMRLEMEGEMRLKAREGLEQRAERFFNGQD